MLKMSIRWHSGGGEEVKGDIISNGSWDSVLSYWEYYFCVGDQSIKMLLGLGFFSGNKIS